MTEPYEVLATLYDSAGWGDFAEGMADRVLALAAEHDLGEIHHIVDVACGTGVAAAKFAAAGKEIPKKDLGLEAMSYGHVYVAQVAFGARMNQTVEALREAEAYAGPSLVIAYSPCIAHGYDLSQGVTHQKLIVNSGIWPLYRFDPRRGATGESPLRLDSREPRESVRSFIEDNGLDYPMAKETGALADYFNVKGIPAAALVKEGKIVWRGHPMRLTDEMLRGWL